MESPKHLLFSCTLLLFILVIASAQFEETSFQITADALDQLETGISLYNEELGEDMDEDAIEGDAPNRRSLFWKRVFHYYISYGALSANRIPCPPRSGRSYYTHNCYSARGPAHPYTRGCSAITRCRR